MLARRLSRVPIGLAAGLVALLIAGEGSAILIRNGSAPPDPSNVLNTDVRSYTGIYRIRNVGCGTFSQEWIDCPDPGAPTSYRVDPGGFANTIYVQDTSMLEIAGGSVANAYAYQSSELTVSSGTAQRVYSYNSSRVEVLGGTVTAGLGSFHSGRIDWRGGVVTGRIVARDVGARILIHGSAFEVDGVPVSLGDLGIPMGVLTGILANGDPIDVEFVHAGGSYSGTDYNGLITLAPEPSTAILLGVGLVGMAGYRRPADASRR